ncbi:DUF3427 domain-containing protein [Spiribacter sp. SSL99]|uniref:DUF3427 domain-containing protein n=1 Tax=Spiribacter sp. SSL99 TaxID=1866884 RepID=UPI00190F5D75|nr:DUF3427 domain-containing protein [Spiribacter sp. SSL99]
MADHAPSAAMPLPRLIHGGADDPLLPQLLTSIRQASEIELAVSFIKSTGLALIFDALSERCNQQRPVRIRIITSDYLGVTDPQALRSLMLLSERGADVRVFETHGRSFHLKAYIFTREGGNRGEAFIGSSNISREALTAGLEWNYRVEGFDSTGEKRLAEIRNAFEAIFTAEEARALDYAWIEAYERRRPMTRPVISPGSDDHELPTPDPTTTQLEALTALKNSRKAGYSRGLVVMATGLGKTYLAAFDAEQAGADRVLFVAHRAEILLQAEATFQRVFPKAQIGRYQGDERDTHADMLFASVQTLHQARHLARFDPDAFEYIIIDEFHHAAAGTYRRLLQHFMPNFLLGLTATPDRADQANILSLCDDNLVYSADLFDGIRASLLCPFHYYGILDETIDYQSLPWRNRRFEEHALENQLATRSRARHALREWRDKAALRTLAFCGSRRHADFMADYFQHAGISATSVHGSSTTSRDEAIERLTDGRISVVFSVDLFSEGVDIPAVDTILLLRPTESPVLFLQQIGRGLRQADGKDHLVVLDFVGNHRAFLNRPQALFEREATGDGLRKFTQAYRSSTLELPPGCFANYDLQFIEFLESLIPGNAGAEFENLRAALGRRPTATEAYRAGLSLRKLRDDAGHWWAFVGAKDELSDAEADCVTAHGDFLREVETTAMTKSYKMVLLEAFLEIDGFTAPPTLEALTAASAQIFHRRPALFDDLPRPLQSNDALDSETLSKEWRKNPIHFWTKGDKGPEVNRWFVVEGNHFRPTFTLSDQIDQTTFTNMVQELVDYRLAQYRPKEGGTGSTTVLPFPGGQGRPTIPYYSDLKIACGHFRTSNPEEPEHIGIPADVGRIDPERHFVARARGDSMNGGKRPIQNGDYLLMEWATPTSAGSITGSTMAIERADEAGDTQYLLREVIKDADGHYRLRAKNPEYEDLAADESMRTFARLKELLDPLAMARGQSFYRKEIPPLFGEVFNAAIWETGHVVLADRTHVLLVTLNKQGKQTKHRYLDHFIDDHTFYWQSQNQTKATSKRGREIIEQAKRGTRIHLFVRENRLKSDGRAAPFRYMGELEYLSHEGEEPMGVKFSVS